MPVPPSAADAGRTRQPTMSTHHVRGSPLSAVVAPFPQLFGRKAAMSRPSGDVDGRYLTESWMIHPNSLFRRGWNLTTVRHWSARLPVTPLATHTSLHRRRELTLPDLSRRHVAVLDPLRPGVQLRSDTERNAEPAVLVDPGPRHGTRCMHSCAVGQPVAADVARPPPPPPPPS